MLPENRKVALCFLCNQSFIDVLFALDQFLLTVELFGLDISGVISSVGRE